VSVAAGASAGRALASTPNVHLTSWVVDVSAAVVRTAGPPPGCPVTPCDGVGVQSGCSPCRSAAGCAHAKHPLASQITVQARRSTTDPDRGPCPQACCVPENGRNDGACRWAVVKGDQLENVNNHGRRNPSADTRRVRVGVWAAKSTTRPITAVVRTRRTGAHHSRLLGCRLLPVSGPHGAAMEHIARLHRCRWSCTQEDACFPLP